MLDLVRDRPAVGLAHPRQDLEQRLALDADAEDLRRNLRHQLGGQVEVLRLDRRVALRLGAERVEARRQVAVGPVALEEGGRGLHRLEELRAGLRGDARCGRSAGRSQRRRGRRGGVGRRDGRGVDVEVTGNLLIEVVLPLQQLLDPAQERSGLGALDDAMVVGRGHRHHLRDPERLDLLRRRVPPLDRIGERAAGDDRALTLQQAGHRRDCPEAAGVGEADVGSLKVVRGEAVLPSLGDQLLVVGVESLEVEAVRRLDARDQQRALALALDVDRDAEIDAARLDHEGLAVPLLEGAAHHGPVLGSLDDRPGDQVREAHLHPALLQDRVEGLALGVEGVDCELAERGGRRDRATLVHRLGERGGRAAERLGLAPRGGRGPRAVSAGEHVRLGDLAAGARSLDALQIHPVRLSGATRDGGGALADGFAINRHVLSFASGRAGRGRVWLGNLGRCAAAARCLPLGHFGERLADLDGLVGADQDLGDGPVGGCGHLGVDLVGGDLDDGVSLSDLIALRDVPLEHGPLGDRLAHLGHHDLQAAALQLLAGGD